MIYEIQSFLIKSAFAQGEVVPSGRSGPPAVPSISENSTLQEVVSDLIVQISNYALILLVAITMMVFMYGLMKYMYKGQESEAARTEGRKLMFWGLIGIFVMTSVWALVGILSSTLGHTKSGIPQFRGTQQLDSSSNLPFNSNDDGTISD